MKPCPKCGAEVEPNREDLSEEAVKAGVQADEWVECSVCNYAEVLEFHEEPGEQNV